ncbi:acyl-CoA thioesterase [Amycolatopsis sp. NPDC005003]
MNLWLRLLLVFIRARSAGRTEPLAPHTITLRMLPTDLDLNGHVNNGRYLSMLDLGRTDVVVRSRLFENARRHHLNAAVAGAAIRYRRPLSAGQRIRLRTRLVGWDDRSFYVAHRITARGNVASLALVRLRVSGPAGPVSTAEATPLLGLPAQSPPLPEAVAAWARVETSLDAASADDPAQTGAE